MPAITIPAIADDGSLFPIEKMRAHELGALHLAISVFVFNTRGELLIQRRALGKYHCGGLWANTCCSHPHWQEDIAASADRRMREELGGSVPLHPLGTVTYKADVGGGLIEHERVHMFRGTTDMPTEAFHPDPEEVSELRWVSMAWLNDSLATAPEIFAPWFRLYLAHWRDIWAPDTVA